MKRLGAYEAKTHLSRILDEVEHGETYAITKHGRTVAILGPPRDAGATITVDQAIEGLRRFRRGRTLAGITIRELIEDGRR